MSRAHMQKGVDQQLHEELACEKLGRTGPKKALGQSADRTSPFSARFSLPFDLVPPQAI
jgi:hypothetical protein